MKKYEVNELGKRKDLITLSQAIKQKKKLGLGNIPNKYIKEAFNECEKSSCKTGNPYNEFQQRYVEYVSKVELYKRTIKY